MFCCVDYCWSSTRSTDPAVLLLCDTSARQLPQSVTGSGQQRPLVVRRVRAGRSDSLPSRIGRRGCWEKRSGHLAGKTKWGLETGRFFIERMFTQKTDKVLSPSSEWSQRVTPGLERRTCQDGPGAAARRHRAGSHHQGTSSEGIFCSTSPLPARTLQHCSGLSTPPLLPVS